MRVAVAGPASMGLAVTANSPMAVTSASAAMLRLTPRQPIHAPTQAARGTPTRRVSDWPLIAQPSARPRWSGATRAETSAKITPLNMPQQAPDKVTHTATERKLSAVATPTVVNISAIGPPIRNGRRPQRSEPAPASIDVMPHDTELIAIRLATNATLTDRSRAMSIRNGARVVPLADMVNMVRQATDSSTHGRRPDGDGRARRRRCARVGRTVAVMVARTVLLADRVSAEAIWWRCLWETLDEQDCVDHRCRR